MPSSVCRLCCFWRGPLRARYRQQQSTLETHVLARLAVQEEQLFHDLAAVIARLKASASAAEARELALQLRRMCAAVRASLETHVRAEEAELWPLFSEHFSIREQQHLVGVIIGRTGAEVLQVRAWLVSMLSSLVCPLPLCFFIIGCTGAEVLQVSTPVKEIFQPRPVSLLCHLVKCGGTHSHLPSLTLLPH